MTMSYTTWERRDNAKAGDWALAALQMCRMFRALDEVVDARYWMCQASRLAVLIEVEPGADPMTTPEGKEWAQAMGAMVTLGAQCDAEIWRDARQGADALSAVRAAGRPA